MNDKEYIREILGEFCEVAYPKFMAGAKEHGGHLWEKKNMIDNAILEAIDQVFYLFTLKKQIEKSGVELGEKDE